MKILLTLITLFLLSACASGNAGGFEQISPAAARERMEREDGHILVDARSMDGFRKRHIPGAVCIPLEEFGEDLAQKLPDKDRIILVYGQGGTQSLQAAEKLASLGYKHVCEFGGISEWPFETVKDIESPVLKFTCKTGEAEFTAVMEDPSVALLDEEKTEEGGTTEVVFTVRGLKPGETRLRIEERSLSGGVCGHIYAVFVGGALNAGVEELTEEQPRLEKSADLVLALNGRNYYGSLEAGQGALLFSEKLSRNPILDSAAVYGEGNNTLSVRLPWSLPIDRTSLRANPGDIVQSGMNTIEIVLRETELQGVKLGSIADSADSPLGDAPGDSTVSLWLEWYE